MRRILPAEFAIVDGAHWWGKAWICARSVGIGFPTAAPGRSVAALWLPEFNEWSGSVGVIEHGPLLMFEWLVLSTSIPPMARHAALEALMLAGKRYAAEVGKRPVMVVDRRRGGVGIRKMAERLGFASRNEHLEVLEG